MDRPVLLCAGVLVFVALAVHFLGRGLAPSRPPGALSSLPRDTVLVQGRDAKGRVRDVAEVRYHPASRTSRVVCAEVGEDEGSPRRIEFFTWPGREGGAKYRRYKVCQTPVGGDLTYRSDEPGLVEFSHGLAPDYGR